MPNFTAIMHEIPFPLVLRERQTERKRTGKGIEERKTGGKQNKEEREDTKESKGTVIITEVCPESRVS